MHLTRNKSQQSIMARIMRNGKMHQKSFSRKKHKTWKAAEAAGREWIEAKKKELGPSRANEVGRMTKRNKSGVVGVCRLVKTVRKNGNVYQYPQWNAKWPECPLKGGIRFTVTKDLPEDDAYAMAVIARQMESVDRKAIRTKLNRIRNKKSHHMIMDLRKAEAVPAPTKAKATKAKATKAKAATKTKAASKTKETKKTAAKPKTRRKATTVAKAAPKTKAKTTRAAKAKVEAKKTTVKAKTRTRKAAPKAAAKAAPKAAKAKAPAKATKSRAKSKAKTTKRSAAAAR